MNSFVNSVNQWLQWKLWIKAFSIIAVIFIMGAIFGGGRRDDRRDRVDRYQPVGAYGLQPSWQTQGAYQNYGPQPWQMQFIDDNQDGIPDRGVFVSGNPAVNYQQPQFGPQFGGQFQPQFGPQFGGQFQPQFGPQFQPQAGPQFDRNDFQFNRGFSPFAFVIGGFIKLAFCLTSLLGLVGLVSLFWWFKSRKEQ
jgi:hypothetical protein